jgi:CMP-N,N'-diacetyllegionaminic acid synthase
LKILAIIPARSGSKSISHKNIRSLLGRPLMAYSIEHALKSKFIDRTIVSTDSQEYAEIAKAHGAEVPFLRPDGISRDDSTDLDLFQHALNWLSDNEKYTPEICVQLRPTHPIRNIADIDAMIELLLKNPNADSIRSVVKNKNIIPYKMWFLGNDSFLKPVISDDKLHEAYNMPRQKLPTTYFQNASIDVIRVRTIIEKKSLTGENILGYVMDEQYDIDYEEDFERVEDKLVEMNLQQGDLKNTKTFCIDIDGIIAELAPNNNYALAAPNKGNIKKINRLYENGNKIIIFTARGSATNIDWRILTKKQLQEWEVKYHELIFGKPAADFYIDDRNISLSNIV